MNTGVSKVAPNLLVSQADGQTLLSNLANFARQLRIAGIPSGPDKVAAAAQTLCLIGIEEKIDVKHALAAIFVESHGQLFTFLQVFDQFFSNQTNQDNQISDVLKPVEEKSGVQLASEQTSNLQTLVDEVAVKAGLSATSAETLASKDFEQMNLTELAAAGELINRLPLILQPIITRRLKPASTGKLNMRATTQTAARTGGEILSLKRAARTQRSPTIVALCDISGSMNTYAQMFAHFLAALQRLSSPTHGFVFSTQLTKLGGGGGSLSATPTAIGQTAPDWGGGTRIDSCIGQFNQQWSRRLLTSGADVLLATDGLERDIQLDSFKHEIQRLAKSCRRLIWLNPLMRYDGYAALAAGARLIAKSATVAISIHNIESLANLAKLLVTSNNRL